MEIHDFKPKTPRKKRKVIGRGGKRGTTSGKGTKGQKSRAGASVRPGFRGGDNRIWQLFPKSRGASKKHGNKRPHHKHRFFAITREKPYEVNLSALGAFKEGDTVSLQTMATHGIIPANTKRVKVLGGGEMKKKLSFQGVRVSLPAKEKIEKAGGTVQL